MTIENCQHHVSSCYTQAIAVVIYEEVRGSNCIQFPKVTTSFSFAVVMHTPVRVGCSSFAGSQFVRPSAPGSLVLRSFSLAKTYVRPPRLSVESCLSESEFSFPTRFTNYAMTQSHACLSPMLNSSSVCRRDLCSMGCTCPASEYFRLSHGWHKKDGSKLGPVRFRKPNSTQ